MANFNRALKSKSGYIKFTLSIIILLSIKSICLGFNDTTNLSYKISSIDKNLDFIKNIDAHSDSIKTLIQSTLKESLSINYTSGIISSYFRLGVFFMRNDNYDSAITYFEKGAYYDIDDYNLSAQFSWNLANLYRVTGEYSKSLEKSLTLKQLIESGKTERYKYQVYNLLALSYQTLMEYDLAKANFIISAQKALQAGNEAYAGIVYANIGKLFYDLGNYDQALNYFEKGTILEKKHNYLSSLANSYTVIGNIYLKQNELDSAEKYFFSAAKINTEKENHTGLSYTLLGISQYHFQKEDYKMALTHINLTINLALEHNTRSVLKDAYKIKAEIHNQNKEYKEAYDALELFFKYYNELYDVKEINKAKALEQKLVQHEKENQLFELELEKQKTITNLLLAIIILSIIIVFTILVFLLHSKNSNKALKKSKIKAEESDKLKSQFLQTISHEIRTPLNGILGFSEMLSNKDLSEKEIQELKLLLHKNSNDLTSTIENLVDIAHLTTNQYNISLSGFSLFDLMQSIKKSGEESLIILNKQKLNLEFESSDDLKIISDRLILKKILLHLIKNAIQYTENGNIYVGYTVYKRSVQFYVKDTGIGIIKEKQNIIFSPFRQADENINIKVGGTGLGLSIVAKFVELLKGTIKVESEINQGSTFYITIPIR